ncbi:MAG: hypothetical protein GY822_13415 [Deltaproteobacteria bacterium]|nr:hypothetical protein [Deltaproteobacteria bacterium]
MLSSLAVVLAVGILAPSQVSVPSGRRFVLQNPVEVQFTVPTNVGPVTGTMEVVRLDTLGIEGSGRFEIRMSVDPQSVQTGDPLMDAFIGNVLGPSLVSFASTDRISPRFRPGAGKVPHDEMWRAVAWMDNRRRHRRLELFYQWTPEQDAGVLSIDHSSSWKGLGMPQVRHPFVKITGDVKLKVQAKLVRAR